MVSITEKHNCCGCGSCSQRCPKSAISMVEDKEGFLYPIINNEKCIDCGLCESVCPIINKAEPRIPKNTYAVISKNELVRAESSSGGVFTVLAQNVICQGGVVFGASFNDTWDVEICHTESLEGLKKFRGSKYVQASIGLSYKKCESFLKEGRLVLFSGTPCQIAGLKTFLRKDYTNLLSVDFACHGVPSPKVWRKYLREITHLGNICRVSMRSKHSGWKDFGFKLDYNEEEKCCTISTLATDNDYMKAFLGDLILRPSCHDCKVKSFRSGSDITIADFWGIWKLDPSMYDNKGTSLVFVNSEKGEKILSSDELMLKRTSNKDACLYNTALLKSSIPHRNRSVFFAHIDDQEGVTYLIKKYATLTNKQLIKKIIRNLINIPSLVVSRISVNKNNSMGGQLIIMNMKEIRYFQRFYLEINRQVGRVIVFLSNLKYNENRYNNISLGSKLWWRASSLCPPGISKTPGP